MKYLILLLIAIPCFADTPPARVINSQTYSGDGTTAIGHTGTALNVEVVNPSASPVPVTGLGTAGTPSGGVVSVQGVAGGQPVVDNITQIGGNAINTGIGAAGTGTARVSVSNDSKIIPWDGTNQATFKASSTAPVIADTAIVTSERPDNIGTPTFASVSCATSSTTLLAAGTALNYLMIRNPVTATAVVWIRYDGSAATAAAPSIDLPPGAEWDGFASGTSFLSSAQFNCISGGASASTLSTNYK